MKLTILGNRSPYPTEFSGGSSYLLQEEGQNILLDIGPDTLGNLQKIIPCYKLDAVVISHLHLDHFLDLLPLHYAIMLAIKNGQREDALAVYLPFTESSELDFIRAKVGEEFHLQEISADTQLQLGTFNFEFHMTDHSKECLGMKVSNGESSLGYTADTASDDELIDFFAGSDLLLAESSLLARDAERRSLGHMTVQDAAEFAFKADVGKLVLTHLGSTYELAEIEAEVPGFDFEVEVSKVLKSYFIS